MHRVDGRQRAFKVLARFHTIGWAEKDWDQNGLIASAVSARFTRVLISWGLIQQ